MVVMHSPKISAAVEGMREDARGLRLEKRILLDKGHRLSCQGLGKKRSHDCVMPLDQRPDRGESSPPESRFWHVSSTATRALWLDVGARRWSSRMLAVTGLSDDAMPSLVEGNAQAGRLRADLAERWGMTTAPIVAGGAGGQRGGRSRAWCRAAGLRFRILQA
jgi:hypothetical protein